MLRSLKWRIIRWGPVLHHLRLLLLVVHHAMCRTLAWPCNTWWQILNPEHRLEFQQLKWIPASHLPGAGNTACPFWVPVAQPVCCCRALLPGCASPWCPSCTVTKGDTNRGAALQFQGLSHKLSYEPSWKSPYRPVRPQEATKSHWPFAPELSHCDAPYSAIS